MESATDVSAAAASSGDRACRSHANRGTNGAASRAWMCCDISPGSGCLDSAILICAGASQCDLMQKGFDEIGLSRRRVMGSASESLAATARALVAVDARAAPNQVALTVIGRPPDKFVIPWSDAASVAGHDITSMLTPPQLSQVERRLRGLWPPGPGSLGSAAAAFLRGGAHGLASHLQRVRLARSGERNEGARVRVARIDRTARTRACHGAEADITRSSSRG